MNTTLQLVGPDHPALHSRAAELTVADRMNHQNTIKLMQEAVVKASAAGLAAPQIGLPLRLFVSSNPNFPVVINPTWHQVGTDFISKPERCLSRMDYSTYVRRPARIHASWEDGEGAKCMKVIESMDARVFMHLADLLDGRPIWKHSS